MSGTNKFVLEYSTGWYDSREDHVVPVYYDGTKKDLELFIKTKYKQIMAQRALGLTFNKLFEVRRRVPVRWQVRVGNKIFDLSDFGEGNRYYGPSVYELDEWFDYE